MIFVCIGCGTVGRAWAIVFARSGHTVRLHDANPSFVRDVALPAMKATLTDLGLDEPVEDIMGRFAVCDDIATAVSGADWVQESIREDLALKKAVIVEIAATAPRDAIIASSTSALPGSLFLSDIPYPERALVAHPVNPPSHIPLVELCGTGLTSDDTRARAREVMTALGQDPIMVNKEIDGFILNRLQYVMFAEAMHLVGEGYCSAEDVDKVMTSGLALRWASIGPFMTAHLNAAQGFAGFVDQLEPMMKKMGTDAVTDYDWGAELVEKIHAKMEALVPVENIPEAQRWRDRKILATRASQEPVNSVRATPR
ncbi:3-hydroxyacyl-CoA dehydrogenase NAD-binding domain-containing protein [Roseovarius sp. D0-M9]|uniref:3-hydroxyacyl-CoA dehydrogenase NAD-binding domain-containing protein n=1 Tax=Roseovarius sp. D0-M9 TaxID=3127117 RepID=UPI00300F9B0B